MFFTLSFCYIMYYIVPEIYIGRRFLKEGCYSPKTTVAEESLISYNLTQKAPETQNP